MIIEKFRTMDGLMIRSSDKADREIFKHCAGSYEVPSKQQKRVIDMLRLHGFYCVVITNHKSV